MAHSPQTLARFNRAMPPNVIRIADPTNEGAGSKCFIVSWADFRVALSPEAPDHFTRAVSRRRYSLSMPAMRIAAGNCRDGSTRHDTTPWNGCPCS